jgi:hypothetical protein
MTGAVLEHTTTMKEPGIDCQCERLRVGDAGGRSVHR